MGGVTSLDTHGILNPTAPSPMRFLRIVCRPLTSQAERTFLAWVNIAVLVMFASLSLMSNIPNTGGVGATAAGGAGRAEGCGSGSMCRASMVREGVSKEIRRCD